MTMGVFDFKSIRRSLERQEQKAEFEEKNPTSFVDPVTAKVVWTPEQGYGTAATSSPYAPPYWLTCAPKLVDLLLCTGIKL